MDAPDKHPKDSLFLSLAERVVPGLNVTGSSTTEPPGNSSVGEMDASKDNLFLTLVERVVPGLNVTGSSISSSSTREPQGNSSHGHVAVAVKVESSAAGTSEFRLRVQFAESKSSEQETSGRSPRAHGMETRPMSKLRRTMSDELFNQRLEQTYRERQELSTWKVFVYAYQTLGVVYGDLGTSPLYVYPTIHFRNAPNEADYLGVLSMIFWTLTLVGLLKYTYIVLDADDHGEGGTFALYSYLCQHVNVGQHVDKHYKRLDSDKKLTHFSKRSLVNSATRHMLVRSQLARKILLFIVLMGTCMIIGDGVLTPAISVLSAIDGIQMEVPSMSSMSVQLISAAILVILFLLQRFGTAKVAFLFSPVMLAWLVTTPIIGIYNINRYHRFIFKAFSPHYFIKLFKSRGVDAWRMLGGTVLCITGVEAMFADMGHFNKRSIQLAFTTVVYPSVLLTYAGETAYLIRHPTEHSNGFFACIPKSVYWPMFVIATLAAVVASQGLVSATFSIIKQSVALDYFPRVKLTHTSSEEEGQVYSPEINYTLMLLCISTIFGFRGGPEIGNAFGLAAMGVMSITTVLLTIVMLTVWETHWLFALSFLLLFGLVEGVYLSALMQKVPQGGWVPFVIAAVLLVIMLTWTYGRRKKLEYELRNKIDIYSLGVLLNNTESRRVPGMCFFYSDLMHGVPPVIRQYVRLLRSLHQVIVFTTIRFLPINTVLPAERFLVGSLGFKGVYRCVAQYGYREIFSAEGDDFVSEVVASLMEYLESAEDYHMKHGNWKRSSTQGGQGGHEMGNEAPTTALMEDVKESASYQKWATEDTKELRLAAEHGAIFVLGKSRLKVTSDSSWIDRIVIGKMYAFLKKNCRSPVATWKIPPGQSLEVGMLYEI